MSSNEVIDLMVTIEKKDLHIKELEREIDRLEKVIIALKANNAMRLK